MLLLLTLDAMDLGPVLAVMPDIVTFEIVTTGNSKEDVLVSCSHEHIATPTPYSEDHITGDDNVTSYSNSIESKNNTDN